MLWKFLSIYMKTKKKDEESFDSPYAAVKDWLENEKIWVHWPSKEPESMSWNSLIDVAVETTDEGPLWGGLFCKRLKKFMLLFLWSST